MNRYLAPLGRIAATLVLVAIAVLVAVWLWRRYEVDPWTRDGRVRADVVRVTPDVGGLITEVKVRDNQQVNPGDLLFVVDRPRYALALEQANAAIQSARATLGQARREAKRDLALGNLVAAEAHEQNVARVATAQAALAQAEAQADAARLNLSRTNIKASVAGSISTPAILSRRGSRRWRWSIAIRCASRPISRKPSSAASASATRRISG